MTKINLTADQLAHLAHLFTPPIGMIVKASWPTVRKSVQNGQSQNEINAGNPNCRLETELAINGQILSGCLARTEKFVVRLMTLSSWLMGYNVHYLKWWGRSIATFRVKHGDEWLWVYLLTMDEKEIEKIVGPLWN
jgi:hypothetical protein